MTRVTFTSPRNQCLQTKFSYNTSLGIFNFYFFVPLFPWFTLRSKSDKTVEDVAHAIDLGRGNIGEMKKKRDERSQHSLYVTLNKLASTIVLPWHLHRKAYKKGLPVSTRTFSSIAGLARSPSPRSFHRSSAVTRVSARTYTRIVLHDSTSRRENGEKIEHIQLTV